MLQAVIQLKLPCNQNIIKTQLRDLMKQKKDTVKLWYNGPGYNGHSLNTDFFLVPDEFLLISMYDNTVKTDSDSTDFCLL